MSTPQRCKVIVRIGLLNDNRKLWAICDRPKDHPVGRHKGRLAISEEVYGVIEWAGS